MSGLQHTPVFYWSYTSRKEQKKNEETYREGKNQSQRRDGRKRLNSLALAGGKASDFGSKVAKERASCSGLLLR